MIYRANQAADGAPRHERGQEPRNPVAPLINAVINLVGWGLNLIESIAPAPLNGICAYLREMMST